MSSALSLTSANFESEVMESQIPVLVDFWAEWCGPCKMLGPTIDQLAVDYAGKIKICKLDVQTEAALAGKYGVASIPTLLFFNDGEVVDRAVGLQPKSAIIAKLSVIINQNNSTVKVIGSSKSISDEIEDLHNLYKQNILTEEEFTRAKSVFIGKPKDKQQMIVNLIRNLAQMKKENIINESEYTFKKRQLLTSRDIS